MTALGPESACVSWSEAWEWVLLDRTDPQLLLPVLEAGGSSADVALANNRAREARALRAPVLAA